MRPRHTAPPVAARCAARDCRTPVSLTTIFCPSCRALLWDDTYTALYAKYRASGKQTKAFKARLEKARLEIAQARAWGHRVPRDQVLPV